MATAADYYRQLGMTYRPASMDYSGGPGSLQPMSDAPAAVQQQYQNRMRQAAGAADYGYVDPSNPLLPPHIQEAVRAGRITPDMLRNSGEYQQAAQQWGQIDPVKRLEARDKFVDTPRRLRDAQDELKRHHVATEENQKASLNRPSWKLVDDPDGNQFYVDEKGIRQPRPLMLPNGQGGQQQSVKMKDLTASELEALRENAQQVAQVVKALGMIRGEQVEGAAGDTEATGLKGYLPDVLLQRTDKVGVPTRAQIGNVASLRIKQRSGGAVPAAEMARLKPFVPAETDSPQVAREKLALFATEYAKMLEEDISTYKAANRRVPKALDSFVGERVGMARGVVGGRKAESALSGQPDPTDVLRAIEAELARRRGG